MLLCQFMAQWSMLTQWCHHSATMSLGKLLLLRLFTLTLPHLWVNCTCLYYLHTTSLLVTYYLPHLKYFTITSNYWCDYFSRFFLMLTHYCSVFWYSNLSLTLREKSGTAYPHSITLLRSRTLIWNLKCNIKTSYLAQCYSWKCSQLWTVQVH